MSVGGGGGGGLFSDGNSHFKSVYNFGRDTASKNLIFFFYFKEGLLEEFLHLKFMGICLLFYNSRHWGIRGATSTHDVLFFVGCWQCSDGPIWKV